MGQRSTDNERNKTAIFVKVGISVAALVGAVFFALRGDPDSRQPDTPDSAVAYACGSCGHGLMLTPAGFDQMLKQGAMGSAEDEERGSRVALRCPQCQKVAVIRAERCPTDGEIFPPRTRTGQPAKCPKCGWQPAS